jgi:outer membrane protein OmpA-like peptidoglycan-associated protein
MKNIFLTITGYLVVIQSIADPCIQHPLFNTFPGFEHDKAELKLESMPTLIEMARFLKAQPGMKVYIVGHTDHSGSLAYNLNLSEKRASIVKEMLVSKFGSEASR